MADTYKFMFKLQKTFIIFAIMLSLFGNITYAATSAVSENSVYPQKFEIWNNGSYSGISSLLVYDTDDLYINIKDISNLGLNVEDIEGGIILSNNVKSAKVMFDEEILNLDSYSFENPIISGIQEHFLMLDIIGKCFSDDYRGSRVGDVWRVYLCVDSYSGKKSPSISVTSTTFNFEHGIYTIQLKNTSYNRAESVSIYTAYYSNDSTLLDLKSNTVYGLKNNDELTTFMPIGDYFNIAAKCKIMLWDDNLQPIGNITTIKDYSYDKNIAIPDNKEMVFDDIPTNHKYYDAIYMMNKQTGIGLFNGYEDGTYKPDAHMLKSEFAYTLVKMLGVQIENMNVDCNLKDVPSSHWCKNAIGFLVANNIMGIEDKFFYPNSEITLNEVLTAFLKIMNERNIEIDSIMTLANKHKLLTNVDTNEIKITRGNFTQIAYNFINEYYK